MVFFGDIIDAVTDALTVDADEINDVINKTSAQAVELVDDNFKKARQLVTPAAFGSYSGAQVVVSAHESAHTITEQTIADVQKSLQDFAAGLRAALAETQNVDQSSKNRLDSAVLGAMSQIDAGDAGQGTHDRAENETQFDLNDQPSTTDEGDA